MTTNTIETTRERVMLMSLTPWDLNPRGGELRGIPEFADVLRREGIREDLHVFNRNGVRTIMQGHRRHAAGMEAGIAEVWVKDYGKLDDAEAMEVLISLQNGSDPFDSRELARAARSLVKLGRTADEVALVFHRTPETVQLYLDLETLPAVVQEAVWKGRITLEIADLMRGLASREKQEEAMGMILRDRVTGQPMSTAQARVLLQEAFLKPQRWEKAWLDMIPKLKRKLADATFVAWVDRDEYVMSDALPQSAYARADEYIDSATLTKPAEPMTWGDLAAVYGVPIFIAPAMATADKFLMLVPMKAVRDADSGADEPRLAGKRKTRVIETDDDNNAGDTGEPAPEWKQLYDDLAATADTRTDVEPAYVFPLERWRAVHAALVKRPDAALQNKLWEPLMGAQWDALAGLLPAEVHAAMMGEFNRDEVKRKGLRWCFLAVLAVAMCEGNAAEYEEEMAAIEEAVG